MMGVERASEKQPSAGLSCDPPLAESAPRKGTNAHNLTNTQIEAVAAFLGHQK